MIVAFYPGAGGNRYLQKLLGNEWSQLGRSYDQNNRDQKYEHRYLLNATPVKSDQYILTHCMNSQKIQDTFPGQAIVFIKSNLKQSLQREWALHGHKRYLNKVKNQVISRLEHYLAFKAQHWPMIDHEDQICTLPLAIQDEVIQDYNQVVAGTVAGVPDKLQHLTQNIIDQINSAYKMIEWHLDYYSQYPVDMSAASQVIDIDNAKNEFETLMKTELNLYHSEIFDQVWSTVNE